MKTKRDTGLVSIESVYEEIVYSESNGHVTDDVTCYYSVCDRFETALKRHCPSCCIPYIDTRLDCWLPRPRDSALFTPQHYGDNFGIVRTGMAANWESQPSDCDVFSNGYLTRYRTFLQY